MKRFNELLLLRFGKKTELNFNFPKRLRWKKNSFSGAATWCKRRLWSFIKLGLGSKKLSYLGNLIKKRCSQNKLLDQTKCTGRRVNLERKGLKGMLICFISIGGGVFWNPAPPTLPRRMEIITLLFRCRVSYRALKNPRLNNRWNTFPRGASLAVSEASRILEVCLEFTQHVEWTLCRLRLVTFMIPNFVRKLCCCSRPWRKSVHISWFSIA